MLKKFLTAVMLTVLLTSTFSCINTLALESENSMITNLALNTYTYGGTGKALTVSFKNPKADDIEYIELYNVTGETESLVEGTDFSTEPGAVNYYTVGNLENSVYYIFKLRLKTASGGIAEYDISGKPAAGSYSMNFNTDGSNHYWKKEFVRENANTPYPPVDFKVVQNPDSQDTDYVLNIVSNLKGYSAKTYAVLTYSFTDQMQSDTTYRLKFRYKTLSDGSRPKITINNSELGFIDLGSDGWQNAEFDFSNKNASTNVIKISLTNQLEGIWTDGFELVPVIGGTEGENILAKGDFDKVAEETPPTEVTSVNAIAQNSGAKIDYTLSSSAKFVRVYKVTDSGLNLVSVEQPSGKSGTITLGKLANDETHNFVITASNWKDVESGAKEFSVTPISAPVEISEFRLIKGGSNAETLTAGTHSAQISVKNNKMGDGYTAQLIAAVYDNNKLISASASSVTPIPQTALSDAPIVLEAGNVEIPPIENGNYRVKLMLWDSLEGMDSLKRFEVYTE